MKIIKDFFDFLKIKKMLTTKSTSQHSLQWLADNWSLGQNSMSKPVANLAVLYRCLQILNDNVSEVPLKFRDRVSGNDLDFSAPVVQLFNTPDGDNPYSDFISRSIVNYSLYGECFWFLSKSLAQESENIDIRNKYNMFSEIIQLHPKYMTEKLDSNGRLEYWNYNVDSLNPKPDDTGNQRLDPSLVMHVKNGNPYNYYRGLSALDALASSININRRALEFQENFLKNGAAPNLVITQEPTNTAITKLETLKMIVKQFDRRHAGAGKAGKTGILSPGLKLQPVGLEHDKMQFLEILKYTQEDIIMALGLHKTILGKTEDVNRAISNDQREMLWQYTLKPFTTKVRDQINYKLLKMTDPTIEAYYDYSQIMPEQRLSINDAPILMQMGYTRNEINERLGLGFEEDSTGDQRLVMVPFNMVPLEENTEKKSVKTIEYVKKKSSENEIDKTSRRRNRIRRRYQRQQKRAERNLKGKINKYAFEQRTKVLRALNKKTKDIVNATTIIANIEAVFDQAENARLESAIEGTLNATVQEAGQMALENLNIDRDYILNTTIIQNKLKKIKDINHTTYNQIKMEILDGINDGENIEKISKRVKGVYNEFSKHRSRTIARTESASIISEATNEEYRNNGVKYKRWIATNDEKTRDSHREADMEGAIPMNTAFGNGLMFPGDPNGPAEEVISCRCSLAPVLDPSED